MTPLARQLSRRIATSGPISIAEYMAECLLHPEHGYYATRDPLGAQGDFTTAPEISQMFGELLGLALAQAWIERSRPSPFVLAELGPGRGTLMADLLRATRIVPGFHAAARIELVEASPALRACQKKALGGHPAQWRNSMSELGEGPLFLVANEFFDALPIRQFTRAKDGWCEHRVALQEGRLSLALGAPAPVARLDHRLQDVAPGEVVETRAPGESVAAEIGARIARSGGVAIVVDYGNWRSRGDTLQALRGHRSEGILDNPGEADLSAHVDFEALALAAAPARATRMIAQGTLLGRLGIGERARALAATLQGAALENHTAAFHRLTGPDQMGNLFKAIAFYQAGGAPPPGFDP